MNERELERIAPGLGERAARQIDPDRAAAAVVARLRTAERVTPWWGGSTLLRLAAAVTLLAGATVFTYRVASDDDAPVVALAAAPVAGLQTLSADELEEVLDSLALEAPAGENAAVGLYNLNAEQLDELLRRMEG
jgi:hypothetical protein